MLAVARGRGDLPGGVAFHCGDFRSFDLGRRFDAAVCSCNSLHADHFSPGLLPRWVDPPGVWFFALVNGG